MTTLQWLGRSRLRLDAPEKLRGRARYVADILRSDVLHARLVLSPHAHARIRNIRTAAAERVPGVVAVLTDDDLEPRGLLAGDEVFYVGQPVAVVVADDEATAEDAAELVDVEYEPLPAVLDPVAAMRPDSPLTRPDKARPAGEDAAIHGADAGQEAAEGGKPRNVHQAIHYRRGDVERGFAEADVVLEGTYRSPRVHQGYLETQGLIAEPRSDGGVTLWESTQGAFTSQRHIADTLGIPDSLVRVVPMTIGGGFGGKIILHQPLMAAVARRLGRPVRLIYDRMQDFLASKPAPAAIITLRMGARRDGTLVALDAELIFDAGAAPGAPAGIAGLVLASTYRFAHLNVRAYEVLTHKAPVGAYRAPGAPQAFFALESHLDRLARRLGLDPIELRLKNASREGDEMANGQPWPRIGLVECLERVRQHPFWRQRQAGPGEGYGVAAGGWLGGMEPAAAACRLNGDGTFTLQVGAVDLTGTHTTLAMIAAEVLGVDPDRIRIQSGDTENAPFAGTSAGSKVIYTVGRAVQAAAEDARQQLLELAAGHLETAVADLEIRGDEVAVRGAPARSVSIRELARLTMRYGSGYAPVYGRGRSAIDRRSPAFAVQVVKVRVDAGTGRVEPLACLAVQDVGRALNPAEVYGQIHGGVVQGLGRALFEQLVYDEYGTLANASLMDYGLPVAADLPPIEVELVEVPSPHGPFGAKGVGEPPVVPTAAAVANAVADATGVRVSELPITPEAFWRANRDQEG